MGPVTTIRLLFVYYLRGNHFNQNILPIHKKIASTCSHNYTAVWVHILYIVKKYPTSPVACYFCIYVLQDHVSSTEEEKDDGAGRSNISSSSIVPSNPQLSIRIPILAHVDPESIYTITGSVVESISPWSLYWACQYLTPIPFHH